MEGDAQLLRIPFHALWCVFLSVQMHATTSAVACPPPCTPGLIPVSLFYMCHPPLCFRLYSFPEYDTLFLKYSSHTTHIQYFFLSLSVFSNHDSTVSSMEGRRGGADEFRLHRLQFGVRCLDCYSASLAAAAGSGTTSFDSSPSPPAGSSKGSPRNVNSRECHHLRHRRSHVRCRADRP